MLERADVCVSGGISKTIEDEGIRCKLYSSSEAKLPRRDGGLGGEPKYRHQGVLQGKWKATGKTSKENGTKRETHEKEVFMTGIKFKRRAA